MNKNKRKIESEQYTQEWTTALKHCGPGADIDMEI